MKLTQQLGLTLLFIGWMFSATGQQVLAEKHFEADDINSVKVNGVFCDVRIVQKDRLVFNGMIKGDGDAGDYLIAVIQSGKDVLIKVERKRGSNWRWNDLEVAHLNLEVPGNIDLTIENSSGDIRVDGFKGQEVDITATSGDVFLKEVEARVQVKTTSGDLQMRYLIGDVSIRSTSGDQDFFDLNGSLKTGATSGDIEIDKVLGNLDISTTSGDTDFSHVKGSILATSTSGSIEGDYVTLTQDSRFKSTSGDISIGLENDIDEIGFDLRATSGDLEVGRIDGDDRLVIRRGSILVTGVSTSGDQTYTN